MKFQTQSQAQLGQGLLDLGQRLAAEILRLQQLVLGLQDELVDLFDAGGLQAVVGPDGQLQMLNGLGKDIDLEK